MFFMWPSAITVCQKLGGTIRLKLLSVVNVANVPCIQSITNQVHMTIRNCSMMLHEQQKTTRFYIVALWAQSWQITPVFLFTESYCCDLEMKNASRLAENHISYNLNSYVCWENITHANAVLQDFLWFLKTFFFIESTVVVVFVSLLWVWLPEEQNDE